MPNDEDFKRARSQAIAQFHSIVEMVSALRKARNADDQRAIEDAEQSIGHDALAIEVRSDWHTPGSEQEDPTEYRILLCTGGPAVQIIGDLDGGQPENARIQFQDWFMPWTDWRPGNSDNVEKILLDYVSVFYFGS